MKDNPSYYSILPAAVRYSKDLTDFQKILFSEITALANKDGYCSASNGYFAELYGKEPENISRHISKLESAGFLQRFVVKNESGQIIHRHLFPSDQGGIVEKYSRGTVNSDNGGTVKNVKENNTSINTTREGKPESKKEKNSKREILDDPETLKRLAEEYPLADVPREIKKMKNWLDAEGKTKKNYYAFAANWLDRASGKKVNTDASLNDAELQGEQAELYSFYIQYVLDTCPDLWKSETRVLSRAEYKAYLEDTNTPNLAIYITSREKSDIMAKVHQVLDRDKFARDRNRTVFEAYLKSVQSVIHKTTARI